ncbi:MAG: nuclear transport factor 2 family protein [Paucibacter sp.]|nr:nuclear transport factor 2 family protein [Roseateles sp.]
MPHRSPLDTVQAQLDAYNAKNLEALLDTYAPDAEQYTVSGELLAKGREQLKTRFQMRFEEPDLHAQLVSRTVVGSFVVDAELITRNFPEGLGVIELLCVYEVKDGRIYRAQFGNGTQRLISR